MHPHQIQRAHFAAGLQELKHILARLAKGELAARFELWRTQTDYEMARLAEEGAVEVCLGPDSFCPQREIMRHREGVCLCVVVASPVGPASGAPLSPPFMSLCIQSPLLQSDVRNAAIAHRPRSLAVLLALPTSASQKTKTHAEKTRSFTLFYVCACVFCGVG